MTEERLRFMIKVNNYYSEQDARSFVRECDEAFFKRLDAVAKEISESEDVSIIGLTGPTCSGKTTMADILIGRLKGTKRRVHIISLDDFFFERDILDAMNDDGKIDYDSPDTIDMSLLSVCTKEILNGDRVVLPKYDFLSGKRVSGDVIDAGKNDIFIFEGIQVLYPNVAELFSNNSAYKSIYISPQSEIYAGGKLFLPNHIRFLRRLVRDFNFRGASADFTIYLWDSVRKNEDKYIIPNARLCNYMIDSTLGYDINMLAPYLKRLLSMPHAGKGNISELEYRSVSEEILKEIKNVHEMKKEYLSENSLYREFI